MFHSRHLLLVAALAACSEDSPAQSSCPATATDLAPGVQIIGIRNAAMTWTANDHREAILKTHDLGTLNSLEVQYHQSQIRHLYAIWDRTDAFMGCRDIDNQPPNLRDFDRVRAQLDAELDTHRVAMASVHDLMLGFAEEGIHQNKLRDLLAQERTEAANLMDLARGYTCPGP